MAFPHRGQRSAVCCVTQDEWKLDVAADDFSPSPDSFPKEPMRSAVDKKKLEQLYNRYRDPQDENRIGVDGIQQFCDDLSLDPASASVLVIAWKFRAATQCEFSKKEFVDGMTELGCDSTEKLRALLPRLEQELKDTAKFKDFYQFTFTFAKNPGQKGLDTLTSCLPRSQLQTHPPWTSLSEGAFHLRAPFSAVQTGHTWRNSFFTAVSTVAREPWFLWLKKAISGPECRQQQCSWTPTRPLSLDSSVNTASR
ncbi:DCN1-like protein 2 isoform X4 [Ursus maritimus]|uniref:DCN1-like protein n=1 Tax=Ursus maritimus TaxID=29073 RepID=A0A8M1FG05_URSMA|nr:DCN1-like protein 2 isoform X4 [Ursus maritimus]